MKKNRNSGLFLLAIFVLLVVIFLFSIFLLILENHLSNWYPIVVVVLLIMTTILSCYYFFEKYRTDDVQLVEKWIRYNKQREKIDQEMLKLQKQLYSSNLSEYINIKRLLIDGQNKVTTNSAVDFNSFLDQFGIQLNETKVVPRSVMYLGPFNASGTKLYTQCAQILENTKLSLYRSDNRVEKEDILSNIVTLIVKSETILVDVNEDNPNVYYELGISHALGKKTILLMKYENDPMELGFDIRQKRIIMYRGYDDLELQLLSELNAYQ